MILNEFFNLPQVFEKNMTEGVMSEIDAELRNIVANEDFDALYELFSANTPAGRYVQDMYDDVVIDAGLHPDDDFERIEQIVFDRLADDFGGPDMAEGAPISGDGGAVDNFKQQMANRTEVQYQQNLKNIQQGVEEGIFGSRPSPVLPIVDKIAKVARGLNPQNVETGKQIIQANARDITRMLSPQIKAGVDVIEQGVAEAKDDYVPPREANYDDKYQAMVRRVGQKAKQQELAKKKQQEQPKAPVRESRLALLKQIIQS